MLDENLNIIGIFDGYTHASEVTGFKKSSIAGNCSENKHHFKTLLFGVIFTRDPLSVKHKRNRGALTKPIGLYDADWDFIKTFPSVKAACEELKVNRKSILLSTKNPNTIVAKKYKFKILGKYT